MSAPIVSIAVLGAALIGTTIGEMVSEEVRGRLNKIPTAILHLAVHRLPASLRDDRFDEWNAELDWLLRGAEALPVTRLIRGTLFALGVLRGAPDVGRTLAGDIGGSSASNDGTPFIPTRFSRWLVTGETMSAYGRSATRFRRGDVVLTNKRLIAVRNNLLTPTAVSISLGKIEQIGFRPSRRSQRGRIVIQTGGAEYVIGCPESIADALADLPSLDA